MSKLKEGTVSKALMGVLIILALFIGLGRDASAKPLADLVTSDGYVVVVTDTPVPEACPEGSYAILAYVPDGTVHYGCWVTDGKVIRAYWIDLDQASEFPIEEFVPYEVVKVEYKA